MRNMTTLPVKSLPLTAVGGQPIQIPFDFWSEFRPQQLDVEFRFNVRDQSNSKIYNLLAYRGSVTVEEPPQSLFDIQLLSVYVIIAAFAAGVAYFVYKAYVPERKAGKASKARAPAPAAAAAPASKSAKGKGTGKYDEDWIPQEALRTVKQRARK
ncbi:hypothetical protein MCUN1_003741 [Malassezia cuniculi]|uniref:Signal sequence receptor subunit alpha n=1 Tax=Malassezia cuniculi TaxID=948313 RepID=A0AAF0EZ19_9BASI|nr:hypothetical protein MCUN1_003741 [Malassezia cuniculi]